jgi:hypothetical protein
MTNYQRINNIIGWIVFAIAAFTYCSTIEPTASFWDCGEYIATSFKMEVGHPPGAPLYQLLARTFSLFAGSDATQAAMWINLLSAICSAFTILFLFWSVTAFAKKMALQNGELTQGKLIAIFASGAVGALAYTFSDSFWFSAVEGEVYAMSSFFTAIAFWAILKWESVAHEKHSERWIILIAYLVGLSIGVHLLNLLTIPAIVFIYYFKKQTNITRKGLLLMFLLSVGLLGFVQGGVIPGIVKLSGAFELFFVNSIGLPYNSGTIIYFILLIGGIIWGLRFTTQRNKPVWNTIILCFTMLLIGYSSFMTLIVRSQANPPIDENNPENAISLLSYLNREQYGESPLLYGPYYNSPYDNQKPYKDGNPVYIKEPKDNTLGGNLGGETYKKKKDKYVIGDSRENSIPNYDKDFCTIFPRMWSQQSNHEAAYVRWGNVKGERKKHVNQRGEHETIVKPTFLENLTYFKNYQIGHMYLRYFLWNFVGRQNDVQGHGSLSDGNWISGIKFIDEWRLGPQDELPIAMKNNKAYNPLYGLPLILGLIGLIFHYRRNAKDAFVITLLFMFTGLAIVVYLNQYPYQPRERDYAYAASFYAFAMWIGIGVYAIFDALAKKTSEVASALTAAAVCLLAVPTVMAKAEWNDHDRSQRYIARDFAKNYLNSCAPNAIIFTNGDNDTFPLWYVQEVEGFRTDIRVVNLSLLQTDWYIDQMKRKMYNSEAVPFSLTSDKYRQGTRDVVYFQDRGIKGNIPLRELIDFIADDRNKLETGNGQKIDYFPTNNFRIPVDKDKVLSNGTVSRNMSERVIPSIDWKLNKNYVLKNDLMVLDLLATNNWERPIYFAVTTGPESYLELEPYFQLEGLAYRLVPIKANPEEQQQNVRVANDIMYNNLMNKFQWGNMDKPGVYVDENILRMATNMRIQMATLATSLLAENKKDSAIAVLDKCLKVMPEENVPVDGTLFSLVVSYYQADAFEKGNKLANRLFDVFEHDLKYYKRLNREQIASYKRDMQISQDILQKLVSLSRSFKQQTVSDAFSKRLAAFTGEVVIPPGMQAR